MKGMKKHVRILDVLTNEEKEQLQLYERKIILSNTPLGVAMNKRRAQRVLRQAKERYLRKQENEESLSGF